MSDAFLPPIPNTQLVFHGHRVVHRFHRGLTQILDIQILSENRNVAMTVNVLPTAEIELTIENSSVTVTPFTSRLLWLNMACRSGHNWSPWVDQLVEAHDYEAFVFSATGGSVPHAFCYTKAKNLELDPIITVSSLNNDMGCFVFGATMWLDGELDPEGPHTDTTLCGVNEFTIHLSAPEV